MKKILIDGLLSIIFVAALVTAANADVGEDGWTIDECITPEDARDILITHGEVPHMAFITEWGTILTTHMNFETGTWTLVEIQTHDVCLRAFGTGFAPLEDLGEEV